MLDFDHVCRRSAPSVVAMIYPFTGDHQQKFYWGHEEILIPCYKNMADCMKRHSNADVLINFASLRSAYESTIETMKYPQVNKREKIGILMWIFFAIDSNDCHYCGRYSRTINTKNDTSSQAE